MSSTPSASVMPDPLEQKTPEGKTFTRRALLHAAAEQLERAGVEHPRRNAEWMLADVLDCSRAALYAHARQEVGAEHRVRFQRMVERRQRHEPLQYILGYEEFFGLRIQVTPDVLIPRPETEEVVEEALRRLETVDRPRVLDIGTGSGCIALALQHERPDAVVHACDVSVDALAVARRNAEAHDADVRFFQADVLHDALTERVDGPLDLVISNPPYIPDAEADALPTDVRDHEPGTALFTGTDALRFYRVMARQAPVLLGGDGWFVVETHAHYADGVRDVLRASGAAAADVRNDLAGRARMAIARYGTVHP